MNIFKQEKNHHIFKWENLGDIEAGRGDLGTEMPVLVYRLMQYTMLDVLSKHFGDEAANTYFREAGHLAGSEFAKNVLNLNQDFDGFIAQLQATLKELKVGILRMEAVSEGGAKLILTVGQDLDCSGLPPSNETVCWYDEGFIAGILEAFTGKAYTVREVDCWANGDRVCRFEGVAQA